MTIVRLLCVILLGPVTSRTPMSANLPDSMIFVTFAGACSSVASIDVTENKLTPREHQSQGEPNSQIKYLDAYIHSIASVPQDYENSTGQHNESRTPSGVDLGSHGNVVLNYSTVDRYHKLPLDMVKMLDSQTSQENKTGNTDASQSVHGLVIIPGTTSPETNLVMPPNAPISVPLCNGMECPSKESKLVSHSENLHLADYENVQMGDDLASMISDVLFLTLKKKSSLSISLKVYRPSAFLKNKSYFVSPEPSEGDFNGDADGGGDGDGGGDAGDDGGDDGGDNGAGGDNGDDGDDGDDGSYGDDGGDGGDGSYGDDGDDGDDGGNRDEEDDQESTTPDLSVLKPGQTGILLDGTQSEGLLLITKDFSKDSSESRSQGEPTARRKTPFKETTLVLVDGDGDHDYEDGDYEEVEPGSKKFEDAMVKGQTGKLFYDDLSGIASLTKISKRAKDSYSRAKDEAAIKTKGSSSSPFNSSIRNNLFHGGLKRESNVHSPNSNARRGQPHGFKGPHRRRLFRCYVHRRRDGKKFAAVRNRPLILVEIHNYPPSSKKLP